MANQDEQCEETNRDRDYSEKCSGDERKVLEEREQDATGSVALGAGHGEDAGEGSVA